ncbi:MAG: penicillin-binding protein activator [Mariprofundaceae bacterium]|nr:penicillin-binding protein activator [Mariprofundaceae bacterium]
MCSLPYLRTQFTATPCIREAGKILLHRTNLTLLLLSVLLLSACGPKKEVAIVVPVTPAVEEHPFRRLAVPPQTAGEIQDLLELARVYNETDSALAGLSELARLAPPPLNEEAAFRRVELLLEFQYPEGPAEAERLIEQFPLHALVPYARSWLARWWSDIGDDQQTLAEYVKLLKHPRLTRELAEESLDSGAPIAQRLPEWESIQWFLAAADIDTGRKEHWLRSAAGRASLETIIRLHDEKLLIEKANIAFYLHAARIRLMSGEIDEVRVIAGLLSASMPGHPVTRKVEGWASGITQQTTIGVLLPLTGKYAHYGEEALRGIRLALAAEAYGDKVELRVEDTGDDATQAVGAYNRLISDGSAWIIGPLLADHTEALLPYLEPDVPVISLTNQTRVAEASSGLFIHTLAREVQASYMAEFAWQQEARKVVVLRGDSPGEAQEADAFIETFEKLGGEVVEQLVLEVTSDNLDNRPDLQALRERSDNEELLAELDEDIALLSAETELEIRMPINFDAVYLAMPGRRVAALAGQLAYVDISGIPLYGSNRWQDDHLLDDRGRYLSRARFSSINFPAGDGNAVRQMLRSYRETWGAGKPGRLFGMAYDSVLIAAVLGSRLGLNGRDAFNGLQDSEGFPGLTGHVRFDDKGVGRKEFEIFTIRRGKLTPAG